MMGVIFAYYHNARLFKGDKAELYATDGSIMTVPVSALDLDDLDWRAGEIVVAQTSICCWRPVAASADW